MLNIVSQDDGKGGTDAKNNREYGVIVDFNGGVTEQPAGSIVDPSKVSAVSFNFTIDENTKSTFHDHPSGFKEIGTKSGANTVQIGSYTKHEFFQPPSKADITNSRRPVNYVFGREIIQCIYIIPLVY